MGSFSGWTEGILLSLLFITAFGFAIYEFNNLYGKSHSLPINDNSTETMFIQYADNSQEQIEGGEAAFDATQGITLKSSWGILKDAGSLMWNFFSGGYVEQMVKMLNLGVVGDALARTLRILFVLSLIFAILYALFKVAT